MLDAAATFESFTDSGIRFWTGVPDSALKDLCAYASDHLGRGNHIVAANEGNAVAIAVGRFLATGIPSAVYLQNSGLGNTFNPLLSIADSKVYGIPMVLIIGWRGEPDGVDEPQHIRQGETTIAQLEAAMIPAIVLSSEQALASKQVADAVRRTIDTRHPVAVVVRRNAFDRYSSANVGGPQYPLTREAAVILIAKAVEPDAAIVSTTGMASRELFEYRARAKESHQQDFLTVGGMGHASSIALGIATAQPARPVWIIDGDGAAIMHLGSFAAVAEHAGPSFRHIILNNHAHDSVGGQPTPTSRLSFPNLALAAGYRHAATGETQESVQSGIDVLKSTDGPSLLEIVVSKGARSELGRPTTTPSDNKQSFMSHLSNP